MLNEKKYDLAQLANEFVQFEADEQFLSLDCEPFAHVLAHPEPEFVIPFLNARMKNGSDKKTAIRDLYAFFLNKRYFSKMNFLYFAFDIFCSKVEFPDEVLEMTPLPHEDGVPSFKYKLSPNFKIE